MPITTSTVLIIWSYFGLVTILAFVVLGVKKAISVFKEVEK